MEPALAIGLAEGRDDLLRAWIEAYGQLRSTPGPREVVVLADHAPTTDLRLVLVQRAALALDVPTTIVWSSEPA